MKCVGAGDIFCLPSYLFSRQHLPTRNLESLADLFSDFSGLVDRILCLNHRGFSTKHIARRFVGSFTRVTVRTEDGTGRLLRQSTGLSLPVRQCHPLVRMVWNYLTVEAIAQCHETNGDIVQRVLIDIRKCRADYRLLAILTVVIALNPWHV